jgi:hypothetical protein
MGMRFDLETANWLAFVLDPDIQIPPTDTGEHFERLLAFLESFPERFYSSRSRERELQNIVESLLSEVRSNYGSASVVADSFEVLRRYFRSRAWTCLILPAGDDPRDEQLCSEWFLEQLILASPPSSGLVLQLKEPPANRMVLRDIFPAFNLALSEASTWPGMLIWNQHREGAFLSFRSDTLESIHEEAGWILDRLSQREFGRYRDLNDLVEMHKIAFPQKQPDTTKLHILQLSDIHLGCSEADLRLPLIQQHIVSLVDELKDGIVVPIVSGDLMDSPTKPNLDSVRLFFSFLKNLNVEAPLAILGNHDVRKDGWLQRLLGNALQLPTTHGVHWYDEARVGIACFNSVVEGRLARGFIGESQRIDIATEIQRGARYQDFAIVGVLHHHPLPVETPDWMTRPFYERFIGDAFQGTTILEDADAFVEYVEAMQMAAVLHGHEHIPRIAETPNEKIPVFGCGSSVGKVKTKSPHQTCISVNIVSFDGGRQRLTGRLLAEHVIGTGLRSSNRHAMIYRRRANWAHKMLHS